MNHLINAKSLYMVMIVFVVVQAQEISVDICKWKGNAHAAFTLIHDDFGDDTYTPEILHAGTLAYERGLKISSAAVVERIVSAGEERWNDMNSFIAQGHEILNHSWNHDNPTSANWNDFRDLKETKDSLQAHLADSVWQKKVSFFCFPEDAGTVAQLDTLKKYGYIGARWRNGYEGDRINSGGTDFNPFQSNFYGYISKEYGDSVLALAPNSTYTDWWLTYPDKSYFTYVSPIEKLEQRHLDKTLEAGGWGVMEMHSIAPSQIYPEESPWWSPMSYEKYERLLDRFKELQDCDSLWMDVPSEVASYIVLRNGTDITVQDSTIAFNYSGVNTIYETVITLKIATQGDLLSFFQNGSAVESYCLQDEIIDNNPDTVYIDINPANGSVTFRKEEVEVIGQAKVKQAEVKISLHKNSLHLTLPKGNYSTRIFDLRGRAVTSEIVGLSDGVSSIILTHTLSAGSYIVEMKAGGVLSSRKIIVQ